MAVLHILLCIEYVQVPEVIDKVGRNNRFIRMFKTEDEKLAVFFSDPAGKAKRPSMTFLHIHSLYDDWLQIQIGQNMLFVHFHSTQKSIIALELELSRNNSVEKPACRMKKITLSVEFSIKRFYQWSYYFFLNITFRLKIYKRYGKGL